ncbi:MAG: hypothetical protein WAM39_16960, partial [Bryobacteraceae bacterium]
MRTFLRLRQLLTTHEDLARRLDQLEWRQSEQEGRVQYVFETIQHLIEAPAKSPNAGSDFRPVGVITIRKPSRKKGTNRNEQEHSGSPGART